jgi:hypothetical protein
LNRYEKYKLFSQEIENLVITNEGKEKIKEIIEKQNKIMFSLDMKIVEDREVMKKILSLIEDKKSELYNKMDEIRKDSGALQTNKKSNDKYEKYK